MSVSSLLKTKKQKSIPRIYFKISIVFRTPLNILLFPMEFWKNINSMTFLPLFFSSGVLISHFSANDFFVHVLSEEISWLQALISPSLSMGWWGQGRTSFVTLLSETVGVYFGAHKMNDSNAKLNTQQQFHLWLQLYLVSSGLNFQSIDLEIQITTRSSSQKLEY